MNNATKFQEMEYKERCEPYQLATGVYNDYKYYVLSLGSHPCCYVDLGTNKELYEIITNGSILRVYGDYFPITEQGRKYSIYDINNPTVDMIVDYINTFRAKG